MSPLSVHFIYHWAVRMNCKRCSRENCLVNINNFNWFYICRMNQSIFRSKWMYKKQISSNRLNCLANTLRLHAPRKCERKISREKKSELRQSYYWVRRHVSQWKSSFSCAHCSMSCSALGNHSFQTSWVILSFIVLACCCALISFYGYKRLHMRKQLATK